MLFVVDMIRALKQARGASGADRMQLLEQIAVMDLMAAARAALLPHDDLSFGFLRSPLGGLDEDTLFDLCYGDVSETQNAEYKGPNPALKRVFLYHQLAQAAADETASAAVVRASTVPNAVRWPINLRHLNFSHMFCADGGAAI